jgi:hypothetical protein
MRAEEKEGRKAERKKENEGNLGRTEVTGGRKARRGRTFKLFSNSEIRPFRGLTSHMWCRS